MDVKDILSSAAKAVEEAGLAVEFRVAAFTKAAELIAERDRKPEPMHAPSERIAPSGNRAGDGNKLDLIAAKLGLDVEDVNEVYAESNGELEIVVSPSKLDAKKMAATRQIAILVAAGRQGAGMDDWTAMEPVRSTAEEFKKLDAPNFAKAMQGMGDTFRSSGSGGTRKLKLSRPGWEEAKALVKSLSGG